MLLNVGEYNGRERGRPNGLGLVSVGPCCSPCNVQPFWALLLHASGRGKLDSPVLTQIFIWPPLRLLKFHQLLPTCFQSFIFGILKIRNKIPGKLNSMADIAGPDLSLTYIFCLQSLPKVLLIHLKYPSSFIFCSIVLNYSLSFYYGL